MWTAIRTCLLAVGRVVGTINTFIVLTVVYLLLFPWMRLWWLITRQDPMGYALARSQKVESAWSEPDTPAEPTQEEMERLF